MNKVRTDKVVAFASWLIVATLVWGVISILFIAPLHPGANIIVNTFGVWPTKIFFASLFGSEAVLLAYSKLKQKYEMRKHTLLATYLTGFFVIILSTLINGLTYRLISSVTFTVCAATCWLYWTIKTEYFTHTQMRRYTNGDDDHESLLR